MLRKTRSIRTPVKREGAERYILLSLVSFAASVIVTRTFLQLTGYPQIGGGTLHIAHVLWGGLLLFIASLLPLVLANRWVFNVSAIISGVGVGLFIDEVGKFITQSNDYFYPPAAPIIYAFFLMTVLFYMYIRRPDKHTPRGMMYRVLEELTEVLDRDLEVDERDSLERRLDIIAAESDDPNIKDLVSALDRFLENKTLILARRKPSWYQRVGLRLSPYVRRLMTHRRVKTFLVISLGGMGVLALINFVQLMMAVPAPGPAIAVMLTPLVGKGQLHSAQEALWFLVRTLLEGGVGVMMITAGGLLTAGRERMGLLLGTLALILWIAVINLLVYYFDQFGAVVTTLFQFFMLTMLTYYRRAFSLGAKR